MSTAASGDVSHIALRKPDFGSRLEWIMNAIKNAEAMGDAAGALPERLHGWTTEDARYAEVFWPMLGGAGEAIGGTRHAI